MNLSELKKKTSVELAAALQDLSRERFDQVMQKASGKLTKTHLMKGVRRNIARVKTLQAMKADEKQEGSK